MSLFSTLNTGASGLGVNGAALQVIGDNIANVNTVGFKSSRASFADLIPQGIASLGGAAQVGRGAAVNGIDTVFGQGTIQSTGSALDLAISGQGFFQVSDGDASWYTRDGGFYLDDSGYLVNGSGLRLQGYNAYGDDLTTRIGDLRIDTSPVAHQETGTVTLDAVLSAEADYLDSDGNVSTPYDDATKDGTSAGTTIEELSTLADFSTSVTTYDSLGVAHDVTVFFERTGENDWSWSAVIDGGEVEGASSDDSGYALEIAGGTLSTDSDGKLTDFTQTATGASWNWPGASVPDLTFDFGLDTDGNETDGSLLMSGDTSSVNAISQDGHASGDLAEVSIDDDGTIHGLYSNGDDQVLGRVAVATFTSESGLERAGGNLFRATGDSGPPAMGIPGTGGRGSIVSYALEQSNVELEQEFVSMIQTQRGYQANAKVVSTASDTLQALINLV